MIRKAKDYLLHLNSLRKAFGGGILYSAIRTKLKLQILGGISQKKTLVLSPHPDDDVIGCGGTLSLLTKENSQIKIIYLTQGSGGTEKRLSQREKKALGEEREEEARRAAKLIGTGDIEFWRYQDGGLSGGRAIGKLMTELIVKFDPEVIFCPSFQDSHPDHVQTVRILCGALKNMPNFRGEIWSYEVWSPLFANRLIKIDGVIEVKKQALSCHKSQLESRSYLKAVIGLATYRAGMFMAGEYAEAFFACDRSLYLKLFDLIDNPKS